VKRKKMSPGTLLMQTSTNVLTHQPVDVIIGRLFSSVDNDLLWAYNTTVLWWWTAILLLALDKSVGNVICVLEVFYSASL